MAAWLLAALACSTVEQDSAIPQSQVYLKTTYDDYTKLQNPGCYKTFIPGDGLYATNTELGYAGIVIFRDFEGKLHCCDLACPVEASRTTRVTVNASLEATCPKCGSVFQLGWGLATPTSGPAKEALKIYSHITDNGTTITVSN
jgi:nitrite reductase/ring-hydroxylating ferredoxin subunit